MPITSGFNHVATLTPDLDRFAEWYGQVFGAEVTFRMEAEGDHPRMFILDMGGVGALNVFEVPEEALIGDRRTHRRPGRHRPLRAQRRLARHPRAGEAAPASTPAPTSARSRSWATSGRCSSATSTAWSSRSAPPLTA